MFRFSRGSHGAGLDFLPLERTYLNELNSNLASDFGDRIRDDTWSPDSSPKPISLGVAGRARLIGHYGAKVTRRIHRREKNYLLGIPHFFSRSTD